eukprot:664007-Prymnesium_polylepis.1
MNAQHTTMLASEASPPRQATSPHAFNTLCRMSSSKVHVSCRPRASQSGGSSDAPDRACALRRDAAASEPRVAFRLDARVLEAALEIIACHRNPTPFSAHAAFNALWFNSWASTINSFSAPLTSKLEANASSPMLLL